MTSLLNSSNIRSSCNRLEPLINTKSPSCTNPRIVSPASAVVFAVVPLVGHLVFGEPVTAMRWAGVAIICLGVGLVGRTPPSTTREE